jgi:hypothetical protein
MEPNHQLFSHLLGHRMRTYQSTTGRHDESTSRQTVASRFRTAVKKLFAQTATVWIERSGGKGMSKKRHDFSVGKKQDERRYKDERKR